MTTDIHDRGEVERRLYEELEKHQIGMLGVVGDEPHHFQPMTAFVEKENNQLCFFTRDDTDLVRQVGEGAEAMFVFQEDDVQACIGGRLEVRHDARRMEKYWNAVVAAWYPQGKDDPRLTMLCFACIDARVWISKAGPLKFAWEIARANATGTEPDLGGRANLDFH